MRLLRFAYHLRDLDTFDTRTVSSQRFAFQDLLIFQLMIEVEELLARGLLRRYIRREEKLSSPIGQVNFQMLIRQGGLVDGSLPCVYYNRLENCLHNRVILSGLVLAAQLTTDLHLRVHARQLARRFSNSVQPIRLSPQTLLQVERESNRLSAAYSPAMKLIALLLGETGSDLYEKDDQIKLRGFLFDMNRFFQALLSRLLNEYLEGFEVEDEHKLKGFLSYIPGYELPRRHDPLPRPDFAIFKKRKLISLLDAKYRDLWNEGLPREMLYQLIVYALSQQKERKATILYPSMDETAREAKIRINEPVMGFTNGMIILRPVPLKFIEGLIHNKDTMALHSLVQNLVFGSSGFSA